MAKRHAAIGKECELCSYAVHGQEAEELRSGMEEIERELREMANSSYEMDRISTLQELPESIASKLRRLLDDVDARDSLAFLESTEKTRAA